jgi:hypothetical protein
MKKVLAVLFIVALWTQAANAADSVLGVNFSSGWAGSHVGMGAHPTQTADGFSNWTDSEPITSGGAANGTGLVVLGSDSGVTVDWASSNYWFAGLEDNAENALYRAYLDDGGNGPLITIHGLSNWLASVGAGGYTVRLYQNTDWDIVIAGFLTTNLTDGTNILQSVTPTNMWAADSGGTRAFVDSGVLTAGTLVIDGAAGPSDGKRGCIAAFKITAIAPNNIESNSPANGAVNIPVSRTASGNDLVFTINDPNIVEVDVQYGLENDPNLTTNPAYKIVDGMSVTQGQYTINLESELPQDLEFQTTYYWKVIGYEPNTISGQNDIVVPGRVSSFTTILEPQACIPGDLDGDCYVGIKDLLLFAEQWLEGPGSDADFVGDDGVDAADFAVMAENWLTARSRVIINEIHCNPDLAQELVEFVELYNSSTSEVDISGWQFTNGITYTFPADTKIAGGGYIVVTEDPNLAVTPVTVTSKYGTPTNLVFGPFTGSLSNEGETITLSDALGNTIDKVDYQLGFPWPTVGDALTTAGTGASVQLVNSAFDNDLGGNWRSAYPTPGAANTVVYAANLPPCIRQVEHSPKQPKAGEVVTITAKVTDTDGVASVTLKYQLLDPGNYIAVTDTAYNNSANWTSVTMHDDGLDGDLEADDGVYTVQISASIQTHRRLIRYRVVATDTGARSITIPYADDPQPNFVYFVYNGVGAWSGADQPGTTPVVQYSQEVMNSLPVYHLISKKTDVENATWYSQYGGEDYPWVGTLVYDGKVYDHIGYRARGGCWRYAMGKNMWKFKFNRGHYFQGRDDYGKSYDTLRDNLNFSACIQQGDFWHRGEQGMFETVGFRMFNLMGVEAPNTNWLQFRVIDEAGENGTDQYSGDLWGMYLSIEQPDGRFLNEHNLPDGNLYKIEGYGGTLNNQGPTQPTNGSDYSIFRSGWNNSTNPIEAWWRQNVDLNRYYSYRCVIEGIHHGDIADGKNYFFYHNPVADIWTMYPWDLDLTWANNMYGGGQEPFINYWYGSIFGNAQLLIEYNNRLREFYDLFYNSDQLFQLIDECAAVIDDPNGGPSFVDVDRAMWDYNPLMIDGSRVNTGKAGHGRFYAGNPSGGIVIPSPGGFHGMVQLMKNYVLSSNKAFSTYAEDAATPVTPTITYTGTTGYPVNDLHFQTTDFGGSGTFAASKWRIAEVEPYTSSDPGQSQTIDLITANESWNYYRAISAEPSDPVEEWRTLGFDDSSWQSGQTSIGYADSDDMTDLSLQSPEMLNEYTTIYLRKTFEITNLNDIESFSLSAYVDDGCIIWINGTEVARPYCSSGTKAWNDLSGNNHEATSWENVTLPTPYNSYFVEGTNIISVHVLNVVKDSSDLSIDLKLTATYSATPSEPLPLQKVKCGKYEIQTVWESPEITNSSQLTVQIPASVVKPGKLYRVRSRMKDNTGRWSHWSAPVEFTTGLPLSNGIIDDVRMTEVMYNPPQPSTAEINAGFTDNDEFEFVEIKNCSVDETRDLTYVALTNGVTFSFAGSAITSLAPGQFALVVKNAAAFNLRYPGLSGRIAGVYTGNLSNGGEQVVLTDSFNGTIADFDYNDGYGWPISSDGAGHSMVPLDSALVGEPYGSLRYGGNWRASTYIKGSPGANDPAPIASVVINEVMAHTDTTEYPGYDSNDWIELYNPTGSSIAYDGNWYLSDDPDNLKKWALSAGSIASHGWVSFDEVHNFHSPITSGFGLDKVGEYVLLSYLPETGNGRVVDYVKFGGQYNTVSTGRYPDGGNYWFFLANPGTRNTANANPVQRPVVISEIMYNPLNGTTNEEYIELTNTTGSAVNLYNDYGTWRLDNAVSYSFPAGKSIPAGGKIVVVPFDPAIDTERLAAFNTAYGCSLVANSTIFGPWTGDLSNGGERVALQEPEEADPPQVPTTWWIISDQVIYGDYSPWPISPDGAGMVLHRISAVAGVSGDNPSNWTAGTPSPGN